MKPRIAVLCDMRNWAWARKSEQLVRHLSDQFSLQVAYLYDKDRDEIPKAADLYHTYEVFQARLLSRGQPYVTGMTAHVWDGHLKQNGEKTVRSWCDGALAFHANSRLLEAEMRALLERPIHYVPNGVDEQFFKRTRARRSNGKLIVGWVGKPNPRKGANIVAQACELAGNVELRTIERTHRNALGPEEMREFYQDLHVLAVASDMDGTPNPALEAAACGVAIVSNRIGNMPEFIQHGVNGFLIDRDVQAYAETLGVLARGPIFRAESMGEAARATVEAGWTWKRQAPAYARMWLEALSTTKEAA